MARKTTASWVSPDTLAGCTVELNVIRRLFTTGGRRARSRGTNSATVAASLSSFPQSEAGSLEETPSPGALARSIIFCTHAATFRLGEHRVSTIVGEEVQLMAKKKVQSHR